MLADCLPIRSGAYTHSREAVQRAGAARSMPMPRGVGGPGEESNRLAGGVYSISLSYQCETDMLYQVA